MQRIETAGTRPPIILSLQSRGWGDSGVVLFNSSSVAALLDRTADLPPLLLRHHCTVPHSGCRAPARRPQSVSRSDGTSAVTMTAAPVCCTRGATVPARRRAPRRTRCSPRCERWRRRVAVVVCFFVAFQLTSTIQCLQKHFPFTLALLEASRIDGDVHHRSCEQRPCTTKSLFRIVERPSC